MNQTSNLISYQVLGVMSGTSLDGLDLAIVQFELENGKWSFDLKAAKAIGYNDGWRTKLHRAFRLDGKDLGILDKEFGGLIGTEINEFISEQNINVDFISSHGHTVFHQPDKGITIQIGDSKSIYDSTQIPVINNFRAKDVSLGGQGAPLVPIGDQLLFTEHPYCLNLGGIANISFEKANERRAYDICPFNMSLNYLTNQIGLSFDDGGKIAESGKLNTALLNQLNNIPYCMSLPPKSLGYEDFIAFWKPALDNSEISIEDKLNTVVEHCALQINGSISTKGHSVLVTGGGAFNDFFISRFKHLTDNEVFIPDKNIIEFKEAIIFAFLGTLRFRGEINCLAAVTGAKENNCGGDLYGF